MATGATRGRKPASTSKKRKTQTKTQTKRKQTKKNANDGLIDEILLFVVIGLSIMMFLAVCGLLGEFGRFIKSVLIGLFGIIGFVFPFIFLFTCAFSISNKFEKISKVKVAACFISMWIFSCFAQLIFAKDAYAPKLTDYYTDNWKSGGFIGGVTFGVLRKFLGVAGTVVVLLVILVICIILLTDRSFFSSVKEGRRYIVDEYNDRREYNKQRNEIREIERQERDLIRQEKYEKRRVQLEEKRAAELEERRKKAEENLAKTSERIKFDAIDFKKQKELEEAQNAEKVAETALDEPEYFDDDITEEVNQDVLAAEEDIRSEKEISGPSSIFYGRANDYKSNKHQVINENVSDSQNLNAPTGLLNATKLSRNIAEGEIVEITDNYTGDYKFDDLFNNVNTSHKINVNEDESLLQEAYERDIYVDDSKNFNEEYGDVANIFNSSRNITSNAQNNSTSDPLDRVLNAAFNDNISTNAQSDEFEEPDYISEPVNDNVYINSEENSYNDRPAAYRSSSIDLKAENEKPAPVSQVVSSGKNIRAKKTGRYKLPPVTLLNEIKNNNDAQRAAMELNETANDLKETLKSFGLDVNITGSSRGPAVTRYELQMPAGVSVKKITNLSDDIMMSLGAKDIRIEAPIPGKKAVGIELPNRESTMVHFRELMDSKEFKNFDSQVAFGVGKDLSGDIVVSDISKMPHLLIAGATGSGKSVCINTLIMSILFKARPDEVKLIMIDPKMVELSIYNDIPHLLMPVVTEPKKASAALNWAVNEMTNRYQKFAEIGVRDMKGYNAKIKGDMSYAENGHEYMPQIVIVVDELADLMMVASKEVEESICRLAQLARAAGIYLILATQRPSVDVITGLIKANMPSRIAFSVSSAVDSRTILDMIGAEKLLGNGDMLFFPRGYNKPSRIQGAFVSDDEVERVVSYVKEQSGGANYSEEAMNAVNSGGGAAAAPGSGGLIDPNDKYDELFLQAGHAVIESEKASIGMLQRKFKIGFNRAARIMDQLSDEGVVGPEEGTKPRKILMSMQEFNIMIEEKNHQ